MKLIIELLSTTHFKAVHIISTKIIRFTVFNIQLSFKLFPNCTFPYYSHHTTLAIPLSFNIMVLLICIFNTLKFYFMVFSKTQAVKVKLLHVQQRQSEQIFSNLCNRPGHQVFSQYIKCNAHLFWSKV